MKERYIIIGCMLVVIVMACCYSKQAEAKIKTKIIPTKFTTPIQKGKSYRMDELLKTVETLSFDAKNLRKKIKKGKKISLSGKGLTIKKRTFKAKKEGNYKLKVKTKDKCYVIPLRAVNKVYKIQQSKIAKITISYQYMGPMTTIEVDQNMIHQIVKKINGVKYSFALPKTLRRPIGYIGYYVDLYASDGSLIKKLMIGDGSLIKESIVGIYTEISWKSDSHHAKDCFDYIKKVYNDGLSSNAK